MLSIRRALSRLRGDIEGATLVEYCLLIAIIAMAVAGLIANMGGHPADTFGVIASHIG